EPRIVAGPGADDQPDALPFSMDMGRQTCSYPEPCDRRDRVFATHPPAAHCRAGTARERIVVLSHECDPELGHRSGRECQECAPARLTTNTACCWRPRSPGPPPPPRGAAPGTPQNSTLAPPRGR